MNIMLVDSDAVNLKNFRTYIRGAFPGIRVVGTFTDLEKDILPAIRDCEPQLVVADIKFFGGVRFTRFREIHEMFPELRFIVYGTYNESDYMKRAREFGVIDFMYRPVKPADLSRCLTQAAGHFKKADDAKQQTKALTDNYQERLFQYEEIFLRGLLDGHIIRDSEIRGGFSYFNIPFDKGFSVLLLRIDHYRQAALTLTEMEKHLLIFKILRITQDQLREHNAEAFIRSFNEVAVILGGYYTLESKVLLCDEIKHAAHEQTTFRVTAGVGRTYDSPCDIGVSCREADAAFRYRYRMGYHAVIPIEYVEPDNRITHRYPAEREERLVYAAVAGDFDYCKQVLQDLFQSLAQSGLLPENLVAKVVMTIVFRISRYVTEQNLPIAQQAARFFPTADILAISTLEDGVTFLDHSLRQFCAYISQYNNQKSDALISAAKLYVDSHYQENFSVARISVSLNTTPDNLNRIFLEKERLPLFDYVMSVRVREARRLLTGTDLDEETVAVKAGFEDVKYFRSVFKKYSGESPAEYRMKAEG